MTNIPQSSIYGTVNAVLGKEAVLRVFRTSDGVVFNNNTFFESIDNSQNIRPVLHIGFASC